MVSVCDEITDRTVLNSWKATFNEDYFHPHFIRNTNFQSCIYHMSEKKSKHVPRAWLWVSQFLMYKIELDNSKLGSTQQWKQETGDSGESGDFGESSDSGESGESGESGVSGKSGDSGESGVSGKSGDLGEFGVSGEAVESVDSGGSRDSSEFVWEYDIWYSGFPFLSKI